MKLKCLGYGRHHGELTSSLSSTERATPRRSARSCSLRCSSATERTISRPCTAPAWPRSTWPASSEPRWAVSRPVLYQVPKSSGPNFVDATLLKVRPSFSLSKVNRSLKPLVSFFSSNYQYWGRLASRLTPCNHSLTVNSSLQHSFYLIVFK